MGEIKFKVFGSRFISIMIIVLLFAVKAEANYRLSSFSGDVKIKHAGQLKQPEAGMRLSAADLIVIGQGGKVVVLDKRDSKLYTREKAGEIGLTSLVFEAQKSAHANLRTVYRNVSLSKSSSEEDGKMYVEKGKITLALEEYDPTAQNVMIDSKVMARYIADILNSGLTDSLHALPVPVEFSSEPAGSLSFKVDNNVAEPLYINVLKVVEVDGKMQIRISELGQPVGCYVLLPKQSIMRGQSEGVNRNNTHLLLATHYYFSIDALISELTTMISEPAEAKGVLLNLPIYIQKF